VFIILQLVIVNAAQPDCHLRSINRSTDAATCLYQWRNFKFLVPCKKEHRPRMTFFSPAHSVENL